MSLINQMLQDLDKRRVGESDQVDGAALNEIRAVSPQKRSYPVWQFAALALLLIAGVLVWLLQQQHAALPTQPVPPPLAAKPAEPSVSLPVLKTDAQLETPPTVLPEQKPEQPAAQARRLPEQASAAATPKEIISQPAKPITQENMVRQQAYEQSAQSKATEHAAVEKQTKELSTQQRAENEYRKAIGLTQQGRLAEAVDSLQQATKLDPLHLSARQMLVALLVDSKRTAEAEQTLQDGLKLSPEQSGFAMMLARLQVAHGDTIAALETLHKGLPYASGKGDYHALYAALLQRQDKHAEAIEQYQAALGKAPNSSVWLMGLGISLQAEKRNKEAEDAFTRAKASGSLSPDLKAFVEECLKQLQ